MRRCAKPWPEALPPGHRLTVRGLVDLLGIGFTPACEALNRLAAEGCLDTGPRGGSMVPSLTLARYEEMVKIRLELERTCSGTP